MEVTKSDIQKLVKVKNTDSFWNHLVCSFKKDYKIYGEIQKNKIKIWEISSFTGVFYPVYTFEFNSENELVKTKDQLNSFARFLHFLFPILMFFPLLSTAIMDFQIKKFLACISIFLILTFACYLMSRKIYLYNKKDQLTDFYQLLNAKSNSKQSSKQHNSRVLDLETEEKPENEWSTSKIFTRLFTYPFCLALILVTIFGMIPDGKFVLAIPLMAIVGVYLYSDLKMIFNKNK